MALDDIGVGVGLAERHDPSPCEEPIEMSHSTRVLLQVARPRRFVVPLEVRSYLLVPDAISARQNRLPKSHAPLALPEEAAGLGLLLYARALSNRPSVDVVLDPPDGAWLTAFQLRPIQGPHLLLLSPVAGKFRLPRQGLKSRSEEHTSELQSLAYLVCRLLLEKKNELL